MSNNKTFERALSEYEKGDFRRAKKFFDKTLNDEPNHLDAHYLLGTMFARQEKRSKALHHLSIAARLNPSSPMIQTNLGILHQQDNKYAQAERCFRAALTLDDNLFEAHFNLAVVLEQQCRPLEAIDSLRQALNTKSLFPPALLLIAKLLKKTGNVAEAEGFAKKAATNDPSNIEVLQLLGNIQAMLGNIDQTRATYQRLRKLLPNDASTAYVLDVLNDERPSAPPRCHVKKIFNDMSETFDAHLGDLGYQAPLRLKELLGGVVSENFEINRLLDIGCGTGAVGRLFGSDTDYMMGIDIAEKMVDRCRSLNIYQQLKVSTINELDPIDGAFDLVVASDVLPYLGDLDDVMTAISQRMLAEGYFIFTTERSAQSDTYLIDKSSGRYSHGDAYLEAVASRQGFTVVHTVIENLRKEMNEWIQGHFCVWQKVVKI